MTNYRSTSWFPAPTDNRAIWRRCTGADCMVLFVPPGDTRCPEGHAPAGEPTDA